MRLFNFFLKICAALGFSFALTTNVAILTLSPFSGWLLVFSTLAFIGMFELINQFPKQVFLGLLMILVVGLLFREDIIEWLYSDLANEIGSSFRWAFMLHDYKFEMPIIYPIVYSISMAFVSVVLIWVNPLKLSAAIFLTLPLFFISDLSIFNWFLWLIVGLAAVLYFYQEETYLQPNLVLIISTISIVALLGALLPSDYFFYRPLNHLINGSEAVRSLNQFNLRQVGYNNGTTQIGGPVTINEDPFMLVDGPRESFYLRGTIYHDFSDNTWQINQENERYLYDANNPSEIQQEKFVDIVELYNNLGILEVPKIKVSPIVKPVSTLFTTGILGNISTDPDVDVYFDSDLVLTTSPNNTEPYEIFSSINIASPSSFETYFYQQDDLVLHQGEKKYGLINSGTLDQSSQLYHLVYERFDHDPTIYNLRQIVDYFKLYYDYTLDVQEPRNYPINHPDFSNVLRTFFEDREGYCVYFGSALTLLLQDVGIQARYVEGFLVSEPTTENTERVVKNSQAHAWTEIYLDEYGWVIVDATPSAHVESLVHPESPENPNPDDPFEIPEEIPEPETEIPESPEQTPETPIETETPNPQESNGIKINPSIIVILLIIAFIALQQYRFKLRHDPNHLNQKLKKNEKEEIINIYQDIQRIYDLNFQQPLFTNSVSQTIRQVNRNFELSDSQQTGLAIRAINDALYSKNPSHPLSLNALTKLYFKVEKASSVRSHWFKTFIFRVLFNFSK